MLMSAVAMGAVGGSLPACQESPLGGPRRGLFAFRAPTRHAASVGRDCKRFQQSFAWETAVLQ
jgi:hypothetical protein